VKVSVIIPLCNKSATIERTLASIRAQTFTDYEVIVIDDGSTDDGPEKVQRRTEIRLLSQPNAGPGAARNRGIREAQGELLAFLDADDEWLPDYLNQSVSLLEKSGSETASVTSGYVEWPGEKTTEPLWARRGLTSGVHRLTPQTDPLLAVHMLAFMSPWSTLVRADVIRELGGFFDRQRCLYAEDAFLWLKVLLRYPVAFQMSPPLVRYHTEASDLARNLRGPRPIEPFLLFPEEIENVCPESMRELLRNILAVRALKTACMLGYWGQWRQASELRKRFRTRGMWRLPYYLPAMICSTPLGGILGAACRLRLGVGRR